MRPLLCTLCLLTLPSPARAQVKVSGEPTYKVGEPIVLKATGAPAKTEVGYVWIVSAPAQTIEASDALYVWAPKGTYRGVLVTAYLLDGKVKMERTKFAFEVSDTAPKPPPKPTGLHVLIVYDTVTSSDALTTPSIRKWLDDNCSPANDIKDWGMFKAGADLTGYSLTLRTLMSRPRKSLPWVVIASDGPAVLYEGPLPTTVAGAWELLNKFKPGK